jgi:hypothetical protein
MQIDKVTLPSGATVELAMPDRLKSGHQRMVSRAISAAEQREGAFVLDMTDGALTILIQDWTCVGDDGEVLPIPRQNLRSLEELEPEDYETMLGHQFVTQIISQLMKLRTERVSPDDHEDPNSPSEPSSESKSGSGAARSGTGSRTPNGTRRNSTSRSRSGGGGPRR